MDGHRAEPSVFDDSLVEQRLNSVTAARLLAEDDPERFVRRLFKVRAADCVRIRPVGRSDAVGFLLRGETGWRWVLVGTGDWRGQRALPSRTARLRRSSLLACIGTCAEGPDLFAVACALAEMSAFFKSGYSSTVLEDFIRPVLRRWLAVERAAGRTPDLAAAQMLAALHGTGALVAHLVALAAADSDTALAG